MKNVFAHTDAGHDYPAFVSINKDDDGRYRVTVRSAGNNGTSLGEIRVSLETMERMAADVLAAISGEPAVPAGMVQITTNGTTRTIPADEPVFLVRGQDVVGAATVRAWADMAADAGASPEIVGTAREHAAKMAAWPKKKAPDLPAPDHQCCGKGEDPAEDIDWRERYMREVEGLNNEGDPIGGDPAVGLRQVVECQRLAIDDLDHRLQAADMVINTLVLSAGGEVIVTQEICEKAMGHQIESEVSEDRSTFTFRSVPVSPQVPQ